MATRIILSKLARKQLKAVPGSIRIKFSKWSTSVMIYGLAKTRVLPGLHDEALKGVRKGQRSVRLNRAYRVIYRLDQGQIEIINVLEVNKHDY